MLQKTISYLLFIFVFQSCCKESSFYDSTEQKNIRIAVLKKDNNGVYVNSKINSIEWLGANYVQNVNTDTATGLSLNVKANQTQFKILHLNGIDTITFNYSWDPVNYSKGCYTESTRMTRNVRGVSAISSKATIQKNYSNTYTLKLN